VTQNGELNGRDHVRNSVANNGRFGAALTGAENHIL